jgi:hypothetical protein
MTMVLALCPSLAQAQQPYQGTSVERFYPAAPGGGWFVMDELNMSGKPGGTISLTTGYARNPLQVTNADGTGRVALVSNQAFVDVGLAGTWDRFRVYFNIPMPVVVSGQSGTLGGYQLVPPHVNLGANPDEISDTRLGFDVRLKGVPGSALRLGAGAQMIIPTGLRDNFDSDGGLRAMFRFLAAGDLGVLSYAAQLGVHLRPYDPTRLPGSPNGSELLVGMAVGRRFSAGAHWSMTIGPELFGIIPMHSASLGSSGMEGLLTTRIEPTGGHSHFRIKLGIGHSLARYAGSPDWRVVAGVELFGQR